MTDTELLDGLQRLIERQVTVLRTCRSGAKIETGRGSIQYFADDQGRGQDVRSYYGGGNTYPEPTAEYGPDIRVAIQRAIEGEAGR